MKKDEGKNKKSLSVENTKRNETEDSTKFQAFYTHSNESGNIDKVRDILFGSQVRDIGKRTNRLKEDMLNEISALRDETQKHFDSLESYIKKEMEAMSDRLSSEQDRLNKTARELRQDILEQSKNLSDEIRKKNKETIAVLEQRTRELREDKVGRSALAELFTEMAIRLSDDLAQKLNPESKGSGDE